MTSAAEQQQVTARTAATKYLERLGKLKIWSGVLAHQSLQGHNSRQRKNQEAEDSFVRRQVWGADKGETSEDEMNGQTILGDVTNPTPIVIHSGQQQGSGIGKVLAGAALAAGLIGIPGAGLAGFFLSRLADKPVVSGPTTDDTVDIGLKRFSELMDGSK